MYKGKYLFFVIPYDYVVSYATKLRVSKFQNHFKCVAEYCCNKELLAYIWVCSLIPAQVSALEMACLGCLHSGAQTWKVWTYENQSNDIKIS